MRVVKMATRTAGGKSGREGSKSASLLVPKEIADELRAAEIDTFTIELTEDGILFKPTSGEAPARDLPTWIKPKGPGRKNGAK